jgi:DNA/RNA-binding domain of Phe-tRNA-synthetase-like protein
MSMQLLAEARVDPDVFALRPDYRALLITVEGITPGASDEASEAMLVSAETSARALIGDQAIEDIPQVASWREAYRAFGAKPQRTRHSLEALLRRVADGLPRVNRLTDIYNAISVTHLIPVGGEDLSRYTSAPRLMGATGSEAFDTMASGEDVIEHPEPGEVVWCDDAGVTCRRWNWRQARRTALREDTTSALFILDALDPMSDGELDQAGQELIEAVRRLGDDVVIDQRLIRA